MTEKKNTEAKQTTELTEEQLDDVQGAGVAVPDAAPPASDLKARKAGGDQQDIVMHE